MARPYETLDVTMKTISEKGAVPLAPMPEQMLGCGSDLGSSWPWVGGKKPSSKGAGSEQATFQACSRLERLDYVSRVIDCRIGLILSHDMSHGLKNRGPPNPLIARAALMP